ncbi:hypothetical protein C922_05838, partial [Plasmodium inui San Antonio 1]
DVMREKPTEIEKINRNFKIILKLDRRRHNTPTQASELGAILGNKTDRQNIGEVKLQEKKRTSRNQIMKNEAKSNLLRNPS